MCEVELFASPSRLRRGRDRCKASQDIMIDRARTPNRFKLYHLNRASLAEELAR